MSENPFASREPANPFEYGTFVTGEQFCGRRQEIDQLRKAIRNRQHLSTAPAASWTLGSDYGYNGAKAGDHPICKPHSIRLYMI